MWENLTFGFPRFGFSALKDVLFLCPSCVVISGLAGPPSPLRNVGNVWHTKLLFFLYTDVIEMNLPECSLGEVALRDQGVLMPLLWMYVCACVCKSHGFSHVLFV